MTVSGLTCSEFEASDAWLGASEMAGRVRTHDWSATPLGAPATWSGALRSAVAIALRSPSPMVLCWGPELTCVYNDAERDVLGDLHPRALGRPGRDLLGESWDSVGAYLEAVVDRGESVRGEDQPLTCDPRGSPEASYFTYAVSPVPDDDGTVGGVLLVVQGLTGGADGHTGEPTALLHDLRAAQHRVAMAGDLERRRIERDLHDGAQQRLMALRLELGLLEERLGEDPHRAAETLRGLRLELDEALEELRELAHGLYPPLLASDGLAAALGVMARRSAIPVRIAASAMARAPRSIESTVYFCCLEALQNAAKHAGLDAQATIELAMTDGALLFCVHDTGVGFDAETVRPGHGLINLRDRLQALGGDATVSSTPGTGTRVSGHIPLH